MTTYSQLPDLLKNSTSAIGLMIKLGDAFLSEGIAEIDEIILPRIRRVLKGVNPRVPRNYAFMIWFTLQVSQIDASTANQILCVYGS